MIIKQKDAINAYLAVKNLNEQKMPQGKLRLAHNIFELYKKLEKAWDFYSQEISKIYSEHPNFDPNIMGINIKGKTDEEKIAAETEVKQIEKQINEIGELDFEMDEVKKFDVDLDKDPISLSGSEIGVLSNFINFI